MINWWDQSSFKSQFLHILVQLKQWTSFESSRIKHSSVTQDFHPRLTMMLFALSIAMIAFVSYILLVSFSDAASLLQPDNCSAITSPQITSIPRSPQEWLSRYILGRGGSRFVSPTAEVGQHEWLSQLPHQGPNNGNTTFVRNTNPRKLF